MTQSLLAPPALGTNRPGLAPSVDRAIELARAQVVARVQSDGSWDAPCDAGPAPTAQALLALHVADALEPSVRDACVRWLLERQSPGGGFVAYPGAPEEDPGTTASVLGALAVLAPERGSEAISAAERFLTRQGGTDAVLAALARGDLAAIYLALAGLLDPARLPRLPAPDLAVRLAERWLAGVAHVGVPLMMAQVAVIRAWLLAGRPARPTPAYARLATRTLALLDESQNSTGGYVNIVPFTALALIAMHAAGRTRADEPAARAVSWLCRERESVPGKRAYFPVFHSGVWTTSLALRALATSGEPSDSTVLCRGLEWLMAAQATEPQAAWNQRDFGAVRTGGFGFQADNWKMTDCDDTAVAVSAIAACLARRGLPSSLRPQAEAALERSVAWLGAMQNRDGGYPAFVHGLPGKPAGEILTKPMSLRVSSAADLLRLFRDLPLAMGDPSTEDVTGRVLSALAGAMGHLRSQSTRDIARGQMNRALGFLRSQAALNGAFWGRWSTNFLWATAHVIMGACAAGVSLHQPWLRRAIGFLVGHANEDGGFGETTRSYERPSLAGAGPSMAAVTAVVLEALVAAGEHASAPAARAATYLVRAQGGDGSFPDGGHLQVIVPPDTFYRYPPASILQPLLALAAWRARNGGAPRTRSSFPTNGGKLC